MKRTIAAGGEWDYAQYHLKHLADMLQETAEKLYNDDDKLDYTLDDPYMMAHLLEKISKNLMKEFDIINQLDMILTDELDEEVNLQRLSHELK